MEVGKIGRMIGSFIPNGEKFVSHAMHILDHTPELTLHDISIATERITGPLNAQELLTMVEVLEALKDRDYVEAERINGCARIFRLTPDGRDAIFPRRLNIFPESDALQAPQLSYPQPGEFTAMEDPLRRPL